MCGGGGAGIPSKFHVPVMSPEDTREASLSLASVQSDPSGLRAILEDKGFAIVEDVYR